jgi:hypothetical protein
MSDGPDRPSPDDESSDDTDPAKFHGGDVPDGPDRPAPDDDSDDEGSADFHGGDVADEDG